MLHNTHRDIRYHTSCQKQLERTTAMAYKYDKKQIDELVKTWKGHRDMRGTGPVIAATESWSKYLVNKRRAFIDSQIVTHDDLMQEARMGILHALKKHEGDTPFLNYASYWVQSYVNRYIERNIAITKHPISERRRRLLSRYSYEMTRLETEHPGKTQFEYHQMIAEYHRCDVAHVIATALERMPPKSYEAPLVDDKNNLMTLAEVLEDPNTPKTERIIDDAEVIRFIRKSTEQLNDRDKDIINTRMLADSPDTLDSIAKRHKVTRQRIEQVEKVLYSRVVKRAKEQFVVGQL